MPALLLLALLALTAPAATAQPSPAPPAPAGWTVRSDRFADLWFHALAVVGYEGYGPLTLYDHGYAARVRARKAQRGVRTQLDAQAGDLRAAFMADSAFELLHFVPLHFAGASPSAVLAALRLAAGGPADPTVDRALGARAGVIVAALPSARERAVLLRFVNAADDEWRRFLHDEAGELAGVDDRTLRVLQRGWIDRFAPALVGYLRAVHAERGTILVSPALGADGRVLFGAGVAVVAVGRDVGEGRDGPLLAAVRELSYPLLDAVPPWAERDRVAAERARDVAAVRAGAMLLDRVAPPLAAPYRALFRSAAARGGRMFEELFPLDITIERALRANVTRAVAGAPIAR